MSQTQTGTQTRRLRRALTSSFHQEHHMTKNEMRQELIEMKYAVRGSVVAKAEDMKQKLEAGEQLPFKEIIPCNIGNPHAVRQKPITFYRQVLACCACPALCQDSSSGADKLKEGDKVQAVFDGEWYPAKVLTVSASKRRAKAPVKVHYVGFGADYDEWKSVDDLKSSVLPRKDHASSAMRSVMPEDVKAKAREYLNATGGNGIGAYTGSTGLKLVREQIAAFIEQRDGFPADPEMIELHTGASEGVKRVIQALIAKNNDAIMIPKPQYPLYSASLTMFGGITQYYNCREELDWTVTLEELERSYNEGTKNGQDIRGIAVINPGNPTGNVLSLNDVKMFIQFARDKDIPILADEVYQINVYAEGKEFHSFKKVLRSLQKEDNTYHAVQLMSFHSTSKGILGECGLRGGYTEFCGVPDDVMAMFVKVASTSLSSNTIGQICCGLMVTPPKKGQQSYKLFQKETTAIFDGLKERAKVLTVGLNEIPGISSREIQGAMYAFAKVEIPEKAIKHAVESDMAADEFWCLELVEKCGIVCVPGSGFGQEPGTFHFRITILPPMKMLKDMLSKLKEFQAHFLSTWS